MPSFAQCRAAIRCELVTHERISRDTILLPLSVKTNSSSIRPPGKFPFELEREEPSAGTTINSVAPSFPARRSANERFDSGEFLLSQFVHFCVAWKTRRPFARDDNLWCAKRSRGLLE